MDNNDHCSVLAVALRRGDLHLTIAVTNRSHVRSDIRALHHDISRIQRVHAISTS